VLQQAVGDAVPGTPPGRLRRHAHAHRGKTSMSIQVKRTARQTIVEYVLIIAIVVVAAVGILSIFSDTVRSKIAGIVKVFDPDADTSEVDTSSREIMEQLDKDGLGTSP
jgi:hypothetical protein